MQGVGMYQVKLMAHDPQWDVEFARVKASIERVWGDQVIDVQHVGSTAVPAICAKPILDVAVVVRSFARMDIPAMEQLGYEYWGARTPAKDRHLFMRYLKDAPEQTAFEHVHCYEPGCEDYRLLVAFRDYLNTHAETARRYEELKQRLAQAHAEDRYAYSAGKAAFIAEIYARL